jgi:hypothetical protein
MLKDAGLLSTLDTVKGKRKQISPTDVDLMFT